MTVFPPRPAELRETRTRCAASGPAASSFFAHAHDSTGHPHFGQRLPLPRGVEEYTILVGGLIGGDGGRFRSIVRGAFVMTILLSLH